MNSPAGGGRLVAEVWPSRAAVQAELSRRAREQGGLLLCPPLFTFDTLLPAILAQAPLPRGRQPLKPLAGPLLVQRILRRDQGRQGLYAGLAAGRRLPERLWRLLVEVKAAGLSRPDLDEPARRDRPRLAALARLLAEYQDELEARGLADQADQIAALEDMLAAGGRPPLMASWAALHAKQVLWLRSLDLRLVRALAKVLPVRVEFSLAPAWGGQASLQRLLDATARALERDAPPNLTVVWHDLQVEGGPLAGLAASYLDPGRDYEGQGADQVELVRAAGRYGLVEELVRRALELVEQGVPPQDMALVFPSLEVYGPMAADAAGRVGLPLSHGDAMPLAHTPLGQALLDLLELPLVAYERQALAAVWSSPYLAGPLARLCLGPEAEPPQRVDWLLRKAGYLDSRYTPCAAWLDRAADREQGRSPRLARELRALARACGKLQAKLSIISQPADLKAYCEAVLKLVQGLDPAGRLRPRPRPPASACLPGEAVLARDLAALAALRRALGELARAADQAGADQPLAPGRLLALVREVLARATLRAGGAGGAGGLAQGVQVLRLGDTLGLRPRVVLVGGLNQGEFPLRPQGQNLLSSEERKLLGSLAQRPVWRTDDEEYEGQVLRLVWLLANCTERAVLGAVAADPSGREQPPSFIYEDLARRLGREIPPARGGVFGELPPLAQALEPVALWSRLAAGLLRPGGDQDQAALAQAVLWHLARQPEQAARWQDLAARAEVEQRRARLDLVSPAERAQQADAFDGRLARPQALALLREVLASPRRREMSPSALESLAACPLAWFFRYLLNLAVLEEPGWVLEPKSEGDWVHSALARFFDPDQFDPAWEAGAQRERLARCLDQAQADLAARLAAPPAVWQARRRVIQAALEVVVAREMELMRERGLRPMAVEREFGPDDGGLEVVVDEGPPLRLTGRLDRLDVGAGLVMVTDYKHSANQAKLREAVKPELVGVSQFQLPVYLALARQAAGQGGARLLGRLVPTLVADRDASELLYGPDDPFFSTDGPTRERLAAKGEPNLYNAIAGLWQRLAEGRVVAQPEQKTCANCDYALICRAQTGPLAQEGAE